MLIRPRFTAKRNAFNLVGSLFGLSQNGAILDTRKQNLFLDADRLNPITGPGDPVGGATDLSGNGNHFEQTVDADRPIYGIVPETGRRNLLERTESFSSWNRFSGTVLAATEIPSPVAGKNLVAIVESGSTGGQHIAFAVPPGKIPDDTLVVVRVAVHYEPGEIQEMRLALTRKDGITTRATFNLENQTVISTDGVTVLGAIEIAPGLIEYAIESGVSSGEGNVSARIYGSEGGDAFYEGSGKRMAIFGAQMDAGRTPYQRVGNAFDVTEAGVRSIPYFDQSEANQSLEVQIPDLGTDAAIAYAYGADTGGVVIAQGLTVPGPRDLPGVDKIHDFVARDAALTGAAKDRLLQYLWRSRSDEPVGNLVAPGPIDLIGDAPATVKDEAGANDGTNDGAKAAVADGVAGLEFDGTRRIAASHALSASPHTIACRVRPFVFVDGAQHIAGERSSGAFNTFLRLSSDTVEAFTVDGGGNNVSASISIPDRLNEWVFIAASYDGETLRLQVDDEVTTASATTPGYTITDGVEWSMGRRSGTAGDRFTGVLADVSRWDAALSSEEVDSIKNTRLTGEETNLGSYWPMADINDENDIEVWT